MGQWGLSPLSHFSLELEEELVDRGVVVELWVEGADQLRAAACGDDAPVDAGKLFCTFVELSDVGSAACSSRCASA